MQRVRELIRAVPDFPKPGILFRDITPVLKDAAAFARIIAVLRERYAGKVTHVAGIESRGFIFAAPLAHALGAGLVVIRKPGKLPVATYRAAYALEYGEDVLEIHQDALAKGDRVVILDDLIATGGTARAAYDLCTRCGAEVVELCFVVELAALAGRQKLVPLPVHALITY